MATEGKNKISVIFMAEDCRWFSTPHPKKGTTLEDEGYEPDDTAPAKNFEPDYLKILDGESMDNLMVLGKAIRDFDESQFRIIQRILYDSYLLSRYETGLKFCQPVFWRSSPIGDDDYLDQWFKCFVLGVSYEDQDYINVAGKLDEEMYYSFITTERDRLLTMSQFREHKEHLEENDMVVTPTRQRKSLVLWEGDVSERSVDLSDIPSLSDISQEGMGRVKKQRRRKKKAQNYIEEVELDDVDSGLEDLEDVA